MQTVPTLTPRQTAEITRFCDHAVPWSRLSDMTEAAKHHSDTLGLRGDPEDRELFSDITEFLESLEDLGLSVGYIGETTTERLT